MSKYPTVARCAANNKGRDFVCGDIHGGWYLVRRALDEVSFDPERDRLFCVGDLIDRGDDSACFPEFLEQSWFHAIIGNHEQLALRAVLEGDREAQAVWWTNGGGWIMDLKPREGRDLVEQLAGLPLALEIEGFGTDPVVLAHAGVPGSDWDRVRAWVEESGDSRATGEPMHTLLWDRSQIRHGAEEPVAGARHIFHGHTVLEQVVTLGNRTYMDLGSVMTNRFALIEVRPWLDTHGASGLSIVEGTA